MDDVTIRDRFGHPVAVGDLCAFEAPRLLNWDLQSIRPILNPALPPGMVELTLTATVKVPVNPRQAVGQLALMQPKAERDQVAKTVHPPSSIVPS